MADQKPQPEKPKEPLKEQVPAVPKEASKPLPPEIKQELEKSAEERAKLRSELGMPKTPFGAGTEKPAEKPAEPQKENQPAGGVAPVETQKPGGAAEGQKPEGQKAPVEGEKPAATSPKEGAKIAGIPTKEELGRLSLGELLGKMIESGIKLSGTITGLVEGGFTKLAEKATNRFSDEELKKISVDLNKEKDKIYPNQDKSVDYVATVLGLPLKESPQKFLDALKNSGLVFETDPGKLKDAQPGDTVFFQKTEKKGEAYLCAVVSSVEPLRVKMIPRSGGAPQELDLNQSDYFKNEWFGFVKMPRKAPTEKPVQPAPPAATPPAPETLG